MIPTVEELEEYFETLEELFFSSLYVPDFPNIREAGNRLWRDVSRYGPPGLSAHPENIHGLGEFELPPPPPPEPEPGWLGAPANWLRTHPWMTTGLVVGAVGAGLLVSYGAKQIDYARFRRMKASKVGRRHLVVVLGGDMPLAHPLILDLEKNGYIVIASVATAAAADALERMCNGYVRALVLDPAEPATVPIFLRSLTAVLSRKFPLNAAGDPHSSPASHANIHSVISLLTLAAHPPTPAPLEHLSLRTTYLQYLQTSHIVPLQVIQALMPLLRTTPSRTRDDAVNCRGKKTIVVCLPALDARIGLPFASAQAMSTAATLRGVEILRREIKIAARTDPSESMKNIKVVVVDVGTSPTALPMHDAYKAMEDWTASEKLTYGPAFGALAHPPARTYFWKHAFGCVAKAPINANAFANHIVGVVSGGSKGWGTAWSIGPGFSLGWLRNWMRGERFAVGACANVSSLASLLPSYALDALLNLPSVLVSIRNALLPVQPRVDPAAHLPPVEQPAPTGVSASEQEKELETPETGSEAEVESDGVGAGSSWVSLGRRTQKDAEHPAAKV